MGYERQNFKDGQVLTADCLNRIEDCLCNLESCIPDPGGNVDLTGYATEQYVQDYAQPKGKYLTEVPEDYAKTEDIPTNPEDIGAQPAGNYALRSEIPTALPNPHALTINGISYDGSEAKEVFVPGTYKVVITDNGDGTGTASAGYTTLKNLSELGYILIGQIDTDGSVGVVLNVMVVDTDCAALSGIDATGSFWAAVINEDESVLVGNVPLIPEKLPNPNYLIISDTAYDGSSIVDMTETINAMVDAKLQPETELVLSDNLFDKSAAVLGKGWYHSSSGTSLVDSTETYYGYVELRGAGTYRTKVAVDHHSESYAKRVPLMDANKAWIQNITGTITDTGDRRAWDLEFTVTQDMIDGGAVYYPITVNKHKIDTVMMVKDRDYPTKYIPYGYIEVETGEDVDTAGLLTNVLYEKTAVFLGDSICAGDIEGSEYDGYGWAGLIGEANGMAWKNYGRNGGTITPIESVVAQSRDLSSQVDLAKADHPNADYVIFEGGTNDADTLKAAGLGTFSESGYTPAGDSDFTGAFETLVLKILNAYPNAKVGYIVAQKMGAVNDFSSANNRRAFFDRAVKICEKWGIPVLDLWKCNPLNPKLTAHYDSALTADEANTAGKFYTDGQHLTLAGYQRITPQIEAFMRSL